MNIKKLFWLAFFCIIVSCKKQLDESPDRRLATLQKLNDLQAVLDYDPNTIVDIGTDEASADNYYLPDASYDALPETDRRIYSWQNDFLFFGANSAWGIAYKKIYYANTVLDALPGFTLSPANEAQWSSLKAQALFMRATTFWRVATTWALPYDAATADNDMGIPLRLNADFNEHSTRPSVRQTYAKIIADIKEAISLVPANIAFKNRVSKPAAFGYLSRIYLSMRDYPNAYLYADSSLQLYNSLMDYNNFNASAAYPFPKLNDETIYFCVTLPALIDPSYARIDSNLYNSYDNNDLRKTLFFKNSGGAITFKGSYSNSDSYFSGIASSELYLNRAECNARAGKVSEALADLNLLLGKRYKTGTFVPVPPATAALVLVKILAERRKEMVMRFTRWMDIRRLNKEGAGIALKRVVHGVSYNLPPNDLRYALALPEDVLALSGMQQNPR